MKLTFNKKFVFVFLVILIFLLILVLENKESFSLGGESMKMRKAKKLAKKLKTKNGRKLLTTKNGRTQLEKNISEELQSEDQQTRAKLKELEEAVQKEKNILDYAFTYDNGEVERVYKRLDNNTRRVLTDRAIKSLELTDSNVKNMKKLQKRNGLQQINRIRGKDSRLADLSQRISKNIQKKEKEMASNKEDAEKNKRQAMKIRKCLERQAIIEARKSRRKKEKNSREFTIRELTAFSINQNMKKAKERKKSQELDKHEHTDIRLKVRSTVNQFKRR